MLILGPLCGVFSQYFTMKRTLISLITCATILFSAIASETYQPTSENLAARKEFRESGLGIFIHWGIYSMFGQNEWYLNRGINAQEYAKAASAFYPANFNAAEWVKTFKDAGAEYICFTSRHHDGFSMWHTKQSDYNIVDATPFKRDILKEIAEECQKQDMRLHLYYSHIDWTRPDYPSGRTGLETGRDTTAIDWPGYYKFMNAQLTELLTEYGKIGAIWFDGWWDHDQDSIPFNWELPEQYSLIHKLQPSCLIGNNHHQTPFEGEDIQIFERDLPGENKEGLSGQDISQLPLETCITMNRSWGYCVKDLKYLSAEELFRTLVRTAGKGANLLLNVGPQPNGEIPQAQIDRLKAIGKWLDVYGPTIKGTDKAEFPEQSWGVATSKGNKLFIHILDSSVTEINIPISYKRIKSSIEFVSQKALKVQRATDGTATFDVRTLVTDGPSRVIELTLKN